MCIRAPGRLRGQDCNDRCPSFTVLVAKIIKHEIKKTFFEMTEIEKWLNSLATVVEEKKISEEVRTLINKKDSVLSPSIPIDISDEKKSIRKCTVYWRFRISWIFATIKSVTNKEEVSASVAAETIPLLYAPLISEISMCTAWTTSYQLIKGKKKLLTVALIISSTTIGNTMKKWS